MTVIGIALFIWNLYEKYINGGIKLTKLSGHQAINIKNNKLTWGWAPLDEEEEAIGLVIGLDDDDDDGDVELTDVTTV